VRSICCVLSALTLGTCSLAARAQEPESPARALFKEARELAGKGDYAAACPKFEQSLALEVGLGTQFNLADCWEHVGRTASAQQLFLGAAASAKAVGQTEREQVLRERATALAPRISKLVIEVNSSDPKLTVKRDDLPLDVEQYGRAVAIDPGTYVITAKSPGKQAWTKTIEVKPGQKVVTVSVPELEPEKRKAAVADAGKAQAEKATAKPLPPPAPARTDADGDLNYKALGLAVLGVSALTFGTYMGIRYKSANDEAKLICPASTNCTQKNISDHDDAVDRASFNRTLSYVGFAGGAVSLLASAAFFAFDKPKQGGDRAFRAAPALGETGFYGAVVNGAF
jgi:hypothetical protein